MSLLIPLLIIIIFAFRFSYGLPTLNVNLVALNNILLELNTYRMCTGPVVEGRINKLDSQGRIYYFGSEVLYTGAM